jgi:hypothetical protein
LAATAAAVAVEGGSKDSPVAVVVLLLCRVRRRVASR